MPESHPARPALRPTLRWARWALVLLCLFTFLRGGLFAVTTPSFWGPDEDYHMMYVDHVAMSGTLIDPDKPLYSDEYIETTNQTQFNGYGTGPRLDFSGIRRRFCTAWQTCPTTRATSGISVVSLGLFMRRCITTVEP